MLAYHGTKSDVCDKIIKNGFIIKPNIEHWLGNGIYFFIDSQLAKWWTSNPTTKFGTVSNSKGAILTYDIHIDDKVSVLDLRNLEDYMNFTNTFVALHSTFKKTLKNYIKVSFQSVLCSVFDYFFNTGYDIIIGAYFLPKQPYLETVDKALFENFGLSYFEVQVCVKNTKQFDLLKFVGKEEL